MGADDPNLAELAQAGWAVRIATSSSARNGLVGMGVATRLPDSVSGADPFTLKSMTLGNRKGRSTETALRLLTDLVRTAWKHGGAATLLSLDISGAFDSVDHGRLLANLRALRVPILLLLLLFIHLATYLGHEDPLRI